MPREFARIRNTTSPFHPQLEILYFGMSIRSLHLKRVILGGNEEEKKMDEHMVKCATIWANGAKTTPPPRARPQPSSISPNVRST